MTIPTNPEASEQALVAMRAAFEFLPDDFLLDIQASITETLARRAQPKALISRDDKFIVNLAGFASALEEGMQRFAATLTDEVLVDLLDEAAEHSDFSDDTWEAIRNVGLSANWIKTVRRERDHRLKQSVNSQEAI